MVRYLALVLGTALMLLIGWQCGERRPAALQTTTAPHTVVLEQGAHAGATTYWEGHQHGHQSPSGN